MEINPTENTKTRLKLEIRGEDHTFVNPLRKELWEDKATKAAGYHVEHAQTIPPVLIIETKDKSPKKVLADATARLKKKTKELANLFKKIK